MTESSVNPELVEGYGHGKCQGFDGVQPDKETLPLVRVTKIVVYPKPVEGDTTLADK